MYIYWLEQASPDVPSGDHWLSPGEMLTLAGMRFPKRRADWRLGRWTVKCALRDLAPPSQIEIRAAPSGAPEVYISNQRAPIEISLSHRDGLACCAITQAPAALGCDLERIEPRTPAFAADYFTEDEQTMIAQAMGSARDELLALLWSAKESALKALRVGLREDTRSVDVRLLPDQELAVTHGQALLRGWWRSSGGFVRTLIAIPPNGLAPVVERARGIFPP